MRCTVRIIGLAVLLCLKPLLVQAQTSDNESCDSIVIHGLRNISESFGESRKKQYQYDKVCRSSDYRSSENRARHLEAEVFGFGSGGGGESASSSIERLDRFCQTNRMSFDSQETRIDRAETLSEAALSAWRDCKAMRQQGLKTWVKSGNNGIAIHLAYVPNPGSTGEMTLAEVRTDGALTCSVREPIVRDRRVVKYRDIAVPLSTSADAVQLTGSAVTIQCSRPKVVKKILLEDGREVDGLPGGQVIISTSQLPYVFSVPDKPLNQPVPPSAIELLAERIRVLERQVLKKGAAIALKAHTGDYVGVTGRGSVQSMTLNIGVSDSAPRAKNAGDNRSHERFTIESHDP